MKFSILSFLKPFAALLSAIHYRIDRLRLQNLISRGLKIGKNTYIMEQVDFDCEYPFLIEIGDNCEIGKHVRILAHDATIFRELGLTRVAPVKILEDCFIGEQTIILPGVTIGPRALVAAGSVVNRDIPADKTAAGNPARPYGSFPDLLEHYRRIAVSSKIFNKWDIENGAVTVPHIVDAVTRDSISFIHGVPRCDPYYVNADMDEIRIAAASAYLSLTKAASPKNE